MEAITTYLTRPACRKCVIDEEGNLNHCDYCKVLYDEALKLAQVPRKLTLHDIGLLKKTHSWVGSKNIDVRTGSMRPYTSHCKACGVRMQAFKIQPKKCPKA